MVSIEKCKTVLKSSSRKYTDEEAKQIRFELYKFATIEYDAYKTKQKKDSSNLHKSIY